LSFLFLENGSGQNTSPKPITRQIKNCTPVDTAYRLPTVSLHTSTTKRIAMAATWITEVA
jgi:hypothetical protein